MAVSSFWKKRVDTPARRVFMRDLLKEFENDLKVIREWYSDDTGKANERFVITHHDKDLKSYNSMKRAMDRAIAMASRKPRKK